MVPLAYFSRKITHQVPFEKMLKSRGVESSVFQEGFGEIVGGMTLQHRKLGESRSERVGY